VPVFDARVQLDRQDIVFDEIDQSSSITVTFTFLELALVIDKKVLDIGSLFILWTDNLVTGPILLNLQILVHFNIAMGVTLS
jgi:hypothetical protein